MSYELSILNLFCQIYNNSRKKKQFEKYNTLVNKLKHHR